MPDNWFSFRRMFDFRGRASRREFFLFHLIGVCVIFAPLLLFASFDLRSETGQPGGPLPTAVAIPLIIFGVLYTIVEFGIIVAFFAVAARRLHDQGKSAWFMLTGFIPLIGWIFTLVWIFTPGNDYENEYGVDPREADLSTVQYEGVFD